VSAAPEWLGPDLELACHAGQLAGQGVMRTFGEPQDVVEKSPGQPLTPADLEADDLLRAELLGARPGYGWLSEETADQPDRLAADRVWIVDPIDGTSSFIEGRPEFTVSVGLAEAGRAVLGVLLNPATGEILWATRGGGAYQARLSSSAGERGPIPLGRSPEPVVRLEVSERTEDDELVLVASRGEVAAGEFDDWSGEVERGRLRIELLGSTTYKLARVAAGKADLYLSRGPKSEWDLCAGALIVEEAGGRATDLRGERFRYNSSDPRVYGLLATNGRVHEKFLALAAELPELPRLLNGPPDPLHPGLQGAPPGRGS
jgi:myo-inositol-1(or 4)-monophosphatase